MAEDGPMFSQLRGSHFAVSRLRNRDRNISWELSYLLSSMLLLVHLENVR
jgi:hypothetical protein